MSVVLQNWEPRCFLKINEANVEEALLDFAKEMLVIHIARIKTRV
jgi:hypothetical protein